MQVKILRIAETLSTNNYATGLIQRSGADEGTVILSFRQTEGRGQAGNKWESANFQNLTFSLILQPGFLPASAQFLISQVIALGTAAFVRSKIDGVSIKWPNDILVDNRKIAGILIENTIKGNCLSRSVCGVGVNINQQKFQKYSPEAISLKMATGKDFSLEELLNEILHNISHWYDLLKMGAVDEIEEAYLKLLFRMNQWGFYSAGNQTFEARICGADEFGQLILEKRNGAKSVWPFKTVKMIF